MPKILERLVSQLRAKGMPENQAYAVATSQLQKSGNLKPGSQQPTKKGVRRGNMTPGQRAKDRASKAGKHPAKDYKYNSGTNRATLRKKK